MDTSIPLDEKHFKVAIEAAQQLGTTPQAYIESLIDQANLTYDEILAPARKGFEKVSDQQLDDLYDEALKSVRKSR